MTRKVLVTGGCGYLGSVLVRQLVDARGPDPVRIRVLDNLHRAQISSLAGLPAGANVEFVEGDILDRGTLRMALHGVDDVVHLAALVSSPLAFGDPAWMEQVNHWGTESVVESCLETGVSRLVFASSAAVYGPGGPFGEDAPLRPIGPYGQSKRSAERAVTAAGRRGLDTLSLRLGTLHGWSPSIRFDAVVNRFGYLSAIGRPVTVYGSGAQRRAVVHVRDACSAIGEALAGPLRGASGTLNVASENPSVEEIAAAAQEYNSALRVVHTEQDVLNHFSLELDATRAMELGWKPRFRMRDGLAEIGAELGSMSAPDAAEHHP
jgi:nucleoside-diphosphate-sugar epimerase